MGRNMWIKNVREEDGDLPQDTNSDPLFTGEDHAQTGSPYPPREINIGGKATILVGKGDRLIIETPGGGAWGAVEKGKGEESWDGGVAGVTQLVGQMKDLAGSVWAARGSLAERAAVQAGF